MRIRSMIRRHPALWSAAAVIALGLAVFAFVWFEPHKLFIDDRVDEALPTFASDPVGADTPEPDAASPPETPTDEVPQEDATPDPAEPTEAPAEEPTPTGPETLAQGSFRPLEHAVSGRARILRLDDGSLYLRFDDLNVSNGPDLRVYLSVLPAGDDWYIYDDEPFLDLGDLKGNIGNQNYLLPNDIDLDRFKSAVVWCRRFSVGFAVAPLNPA